MQNWFRFVQYLSFIVIVFLAHGGNAQELHNPALGVYAGYGGQRVNVAGVNIARGDALQFGMQYNQTLHRGLGYLFEAGYVGAPQSFGDGSAVLSTNYLAQFPFKQGKLLPFLTVGYSRLFSMSNALNYGGGIDYRFRRGNAFRFEYREYRVFTNPTLYNGALRVGYLWYF